MYPSSIFHEVFEKPEPAAEPQSAQNVPECPAAEKSSQQDPSDLSEKQLAAIEMLAMGRSFIVTAQELKIDRRTLFRWRQSERFQERLRDRHGALWGDVSDRLRMLVDPSLEVLAEHLNDHYDRSRFRAATTILRLAKIGRETRE